MSNIAERLRNHPLRNTILQEAADEIERLRAPKAGWEVEGFIDQLTRRDDTNSERLVLEAISHLRAFSRDCDALRDNNRNLRAEIERLKVQLQVNAVAWP